MDFSGRVQLEIEELRDSIGVFPFEDSKYCLNYFSVDELNQITDGFSENNLVGRFQYGKVYKGFKGGQVFTVKKWEQPENGGYDYYKGENELRQINEVIFLKQTKVCSHPNLAKLKGYGRIDQDQVFMVYDLKPLNSVHNLVPEDSFTWLQRIKVLLGFAHLLHVLHDAADHSSSPYLVRNIDAAHILVDEDYNPILCDYSMITGGIFPDWWEYPNEELSGPIGYRPIYEEFPDWSEMDDVFAFGTLVVMLISKRVFTFEYPEKWMPTVHDSGCDSYKSRKSAVGFSKISLVHETLLDNHGYHSDDAVQITKLAIRCLSYRRSRMPTMKQVIKKLLKLVVSRDHPTFLGVDRLQCYL